MITVIELPTLLIVGEAICSLILTVHSFFEIVTCSKLLAVARVTRRVLISNGYLLNCVVLGIQSVQQTTSWLLTRCIILDLGVAVTTDCSRARVPLVPLLLLLLLTIVIDEVVVGEAQSRGLKVALLAI